MDPAIEDRVEELLTQLTLAERVQLCHGASKFSVGPIPRCGIPEWTLSDGPHGVRREISRDSWAPAEGVDDAATYLPTGTALAATWNRDLARLHGSVLGAEARERGKDVILGPGINVIRSPLCGRNFEYYAEDPYLIAELVVPAIEGIQEQDVAACVKHFACNSQELNRHGVDALIDERTLREIYLPGFEAAVVRAGVLTVMGAYNLVRGQHCCHHAYLIEQVLKGEWGFRGSVISDWDGTHDTVEAARDGLDLEMGTTVVDYDAYFLARPFRDAIESGALPAALAADKARRNLRVMAATGVLDPERRRPGARNTAEHQAAARCIAEEALVLLKNDGDLLPLTGVERLLVVGDNAVVAHHAGGNSSAVNALYEVTPLAGIRAAAPAGCAVDFLHGYPSTAGGEPIDPALLGLADAGAGVRGWTARYFDNRWWQGEPRVTRPVDQAGLDWRRGRPFPWLAPGASSVEFLAELTPPTDGRYRFVLEGVNVAGFEIDGEPVILRWEAGGSDVVSGEVDLVAGRGYHCRVYICPGADDAAHLVRLTWQPPGSAADGGDERAALVAAAADADAVVVVGGLNHQHDTEGADRDDMDLHGGQNELIAAIAASNPRTAVVIVGGSPVAMPWVDKVPAVLQAWYNGMEGGNALGAALFGAVTPSGKLPMTFPAGLADSPAHRLDDYHADVCRYAEGVFVGYRWFDAEGIAPLFPFGHGLSYTTFAYRDLAVAPGADGDDTVATVDLVLENTGARAGAEVVQLYLEPPPGALPRPPRELKGFAKVALEPGEERRVGFRLDRRACSLYDPEAGGWVAPAGRYGVAVGSSSRDLRLRDGFELR